jgi:hypothetical protein
VDKDKEDENDFEYSSTLRELRKYWYKELQEYILEEFFSVP